MPSLFRIKPWILLPFLFLLIFSPALLFAQSPSVTGKVTDQEGNPLEGVSVSVGAASKGILTGADGSYKLAVPVNPGQLLTFSMVGYTTREMPVGTSSTINVVLEKSFQSLNETVVVGYGTQKRKDITGSVVSLDKKRLEQLPNTNFAQALQGAVPGLAVNLNSAGAEGNSNSIVIRGNNSIKASNGPLLILDGIPYNGSISDINPADIESIDVLKDASAAAIYGSRGSNGVILLTTKRGNSGKPVISYDGFYGVQKIANLPAVLGPEEFYQYKKTREPNAMTTSEQAIYDSKIYPDWLGLATQDGSRTQHTLSIRGGNPNAKYYVSATYLGVKGIALNDEFKRASTRINVDVNITDWLTYGTNTQLTFNDRTGLPAYFNGDYGAYRFNPLTTAYDSAGKLKIYPWPEDTYFANPLSPTLASNTDNTYQIFTTNYLQVKFPFVKGLSYRLNTGVEYINRAQKTYWGRDTRRGQQAAGDLSTVNSVNRNYTIENILGYEHSFNKHAISFTGLYSYQYNNISNDSLNATGFPNDVLTYYQANVALLNENRSTSPKETLISQMARLNYSYDSRYLITFTGRRDGFSGFGANYKFAFFPSVALGWNISNEAFMGDNKWLSSLKLRLSYGSNGNQAVGPYQTLARMIERSYVDVINGTTSTAPGYIPNTLANPNLRWETTNTANIGLDFGLMNNRITGTLDVYESNTHDLLLDRQISTVHGVGQITENLGKTNNKGIELGVNTTNIETQDFTWTTNANISLNRNKITELYGDGRNDTLSQWFIGHPIDVNFEYVYGGVWQLTDDLTKSPQPGVKPGFAKVVDLNGDGKISGEDRTIIGSRIPDYIWGMGNTLKYKNFSLYVFVHGVHGSSRANPLLVDNVNAGVRYTTHKKNWWTPNNPTNEYYGNMLNANTYNTHIYQSDAFVRIKDISLSYDLSPQLLQKLKFSRLRVYVNTRNPFTFTKWTGLDPELNDQLGIPLQREYLVGLNISL